MKKLSLMAIAVVCCPTYGLFADSPDQDIFQNFGPQLTQDESIIRLEQKIARYALLLEKAQKAKDYENIRRYETALKNFFKERGRIIKSLEKRGITPAIDRHLEDIEWRIRPMPEPVIPYTAPGA